MGFVRCKSEISIYLASSYPYYNTVVGALLLQDTLLYVSDPKALYHILIKDQNVYDEPDSFVW